MLVRDINPGNSSAFINIKGEFETVADDVIFFTAEDGSRGRELWRSDGTLGGTSIVADINPGAGGSNIGEIAEVGNRLIFDADNGNGTSGRELWVSDGTSTGTSQLLDIRPGASSSFPSYFTAIGDGSRVVFSAENGTAGYELWVSDGTTIGTMMVADINPGSGSSFLYNFTAVNGIVYFSANDGTNGSELWRTDGTTAGTMLVEDINAGPSSSNLNFFAVLDINEDPDLTALSGSTAPENAAVGTLVGTLAATDPDGDPITYTMTDSAGGLFGLNGDTVIVTGPLDFETSASHTITVEASDGAGGTDSECVRASPGAMETPLLPRMWRSTSPAGATPPSRAIRWPAGSPVLWTRKPARSAKVRSRWSTT